MTRKTKEVLKAMRRETLKLTVQDLVCDFLYLLDLALRPQGGRGTRGMVRDGEITVDELCQWITDELRESLLPDGDT